MPKGAGRKGVPAEARGKQIRRKPVGWRKEPVRHGLAAKGVKTKKAPRKRSPGALASGAPRMPGQWERHVLQQVVFAPFTRPIGSPQLSKPPYPPYREYRDDPRSSWRWKREYRNAVNGAIRKGWVTIREVKGSRRGKTYVKYWELKATALGKQAFIKGALRQFNIGKKSMESAIRRLEKGEFVKIPRHLEYK